MQNSLGLSPEQASQLLTNWITKPQTYLDEVLGVKAIWKLQNDVLTVIPRALKERKHIYIASGHALGKDYICGAISLWFLHCFSPSIVIQTAPTDRQVQKIMWGETLRHWHSKKIDLGGTAFTSPYLEIIKEKWYLLGFTTKESGASKKAEGGKFQGFHSPNICVIVSEAQAVEDNIYDQIEAITTSENILVIFIGNPTRASGGFAKGLKNKIDNIVFNFSCLENPNYKQQKTVIPGLASYRWVEDKRKKWGEEDPRWYGRVLGQIPKTSINNVFSENMLEQMLRQQVSSTANNIGVALDVAGEGIDENVIYGGKNGGVSKESVKLNQAPSTNAVNTLDMVKELKGNFIVIDCDGMGIKDYQEIIKREESRHYHIVKYHGSARIKLEPKADGNPQYYNLRAQAWMEVAQRAKDGKASIPNDPELIEDLLEVKYFEKNGQIYIEPKEDIKERLGRSPSKGDAWIMLQWGFSQGYQKIELEEDYPADRQGHGELIGAKKEESSPSGY